MKSPAGREGGGEARWSIQEDSQTETGEVLLAAFDLIAGTSESTRAKTAETFLELLGARVRNPKTRSAYRVAWRSFLAFCSARQLELESVKAYHVGSWLDQHSGKQVDAETTLGGRPITLRFADDARDS
jgi:hypothetical protein